MKNSPTLKPEVNMNTQPLPELIAQSQQLLAEIRNHPQFKALRFDCDVALGDVNQYFNYLEYAATADLDTSKFESFAE